MVAGIADLYPSDGIDIRLCRLLCVGSCLYDGLFPSSDECVCVCMCVFLCVI